MDETRNTTDSRRLARYSKATLCEYIAATADFIIGRTDPDWDLLDAYQALVDVARLSAQREGLHTLLLQVTPAMQRRISGRKITKRDRLMLQSIVRAQAQIKRLEKKLGIPNTGRDSQSLQEGRD